MRFYFRIEMMLSTKRCHTNCSVLRTPTSYVIVVVMRKIFYEIGTTKKQKEDTTKREMVLFCLSDLHGTCYEPGNRPIIECAWNQKPDLILASGDMLSGDREEGDAIAVALLSRVWRDISRSDIRNLWMI